MPGIFDLFEMARRQNADWYTANPIDNLKPEEQQALADQMEMTVEDFLKQAHTPNIKMTCPLCGQPAPHLISCRGCGDDAFGGEWVEAYGENIHDRLRSRLEQALTNQNEFDQMQHRGKEHGKVIPLLTEEQIKNGISNAYSWGGCMICAECWHHTLPTDAYETCPLKLLADRETSHGSFPITFLLAMELSGATDEQAKTALSNWIYSVWAHWCEHWNTVADESTRIDVGAWRNLILKGYLNLEGDE